METRKLYYEDPFQKGFATTVVSCDAVKGGYAVVLAETAFYPEGGGQPYDTGVLGEVNVLEVHEKNGVITHLCDKPFEVGKSVSGKIDWARRFDHMQQHSGEHICSGLICERFHCDNVGFHMGADVVTIDFNADISWDELMEIEQLANLYIYEDHPIDIQFYRGAELDKVEYRSKKPRAHRLLPRRGLLRLLRHARCAFRSGGTRQVPLRAEVPRRRSHRTSFRQARAPLPFGLLGAGRAYRTGALRQAERELCGRRARAR